MRRLTTLALLFLFLLPLAAAGEEPQAPTPQPGQIVISGAPSFQWQGAESKIVIPAQELFKGKPRTFVVPGTNGPVRITKIPIENPFVPTGICYTLRSYVAERLGPDETRIIGSRTCTRAAVRPKPVPTQLQPEPEKPH